MQAREIEQCNSSPGSCISIITILECLPGAPKQMLPKDYHRIYPQTTVRNRATIASKRPGCHAPLGVCPRYFG